MLSGDPTRAVATVDLDSIGANFTRVGEVGVPVMAVVKADAYGHGVDRVAPWLRHVGAQWLGVALPTEALALRASGDRGRVLAWLWAPGDRSIIDCVAADIDLSVSDGWSLAEVVDAARSLGRRARIHLKVDTGLARNGAVHGAWPALVEAAKAAQDMGHVEVVGIWSHLGSADVPGDPRTDTQAAAFTASLDEADAIGVQPHLRHLAASAAALSRPDLAFDLVRSGIALYGLTPGEQMGSAADLGLRPAMTLRARLALVKPIAAGTWVSYGGSWQVPRDTMVGLVPVGYGDGIPRSASNRVEVQIADRRCPIIGRVAMDQFVVDLGPDARDHAGAEVRCFGAGDLTEPTADEWAERTDTIGYEIVTRLGPRIPRRYRSGD